MNPRRSTFAKAISPFLRVQWSRALPGVFVLVLIGLFIFPVHPRFLDYLIVANLLVALVLLLRSLTMRSNSGLYTFPTLLLLTTLYRLALNVASTRLILLNGDTGMDAAGRVIEAFGSFVVQGDFVVGAIIFAVVTIVNFVVISKGSARVAEVAARFALDALPGRQLAIDADLRTGTISREEASRLREHLRRESQFFGAMDGAMRFVQGDAIAGLVITFINSLGGVGIGLSHGMEFHDALNVYGVLTIGDGLVTILPALLISVCAGIVVTYVGEERGTEEHGGSWVDSQSLGLAALTVFLMGLVPGFPAAPFFAAAILSAGGLFWIQWKDQSRGRWFLRSLGLLEQTFGENSEHWNDDARTLPYVEGSFASKRQSHQRVQRSISVVLHPESSAAQFFASDEGMDLFRRMWSVCLDQILRSRGIDPGIQFRSDSALSIFQYRIELNGTSLRQGQLPEENVFIVGDLSYCRAANIALRTTEHPIDHRLCAWGNVDSQTHEILQTAGIQLLTISEYLALEIAAAALEANEQFITIDRVQYLLESLREQSPVLVDEMLRSGCSYPELTSLLRRLAFENIDMRDVGAICDSVAQFQAFHARVEDREEWMLRLYETVRRRLAGVTLSRAIRDSDVLRIFLLSPSLAEELETVASRWMAWSGRPPVDPQWERQFLELLSRWFQPMVEMGSGPIVVVCDSGVRAVVQSLLAGLRRGREWFRVYAFEDMPSHVQLETIGVLEFAS